MHLTIISCLENCVQCRQENGPLHDLPMDPSFKDQDQSINLSNYCFGILTGPIESIQDIMVAEEGLNPGFPEVLQNLP